MVSRTVLTFLLLIPLVISLKVDPSSLRTNALKSPISVNNPIRLSWQLTSCRRNSTQTAYQVQTSHSQDFSPFLWESNKSASPDPWAPYTGPALPSRSAIFWRVRVWDGDDKASEWSPAATFEVSLLQAEDWDAEWITNPDFKTGRTSLPRFAKTFDVSCAAQKARLYIIGLGLHYPLLNSVKVGSDVLSPGYATLNKTMPYSTYDVLEQLRPGRNVLAVELGKGIYDNTAPLLGRYTKFKQAPRELMLLAQLEYTCDDGTAEKVATDESWLTSVEGPWIEAHWYGGEEFDARKETNWTGIDDDRSSWKNASVAVPPAGKLVSPRSPPLEVTETIVAKSVYQANNGQWIFDLGTNIAGQFTLQIQNQGAKEGTRIAFYPGETASADGISQTSSGSPIFDAYTLSSSPSQSYTPRYLYHGFQYLGVNLTWTPTASDLTAHVIRAANEPILEVETSNTLFNSIHELVDRSIKGNMHSVLTDCPHREKYGWLEQDHLVFDPLVAGYDMQAYLDDLVHTIADAQAADVPGLIPDIAPEYGAPMGGGYRNDPNWGSAVVLVPLKAYKQYGDIEILRKRRREMVEYVDYLVRRAGGNMFLDDGGLGDWLALDTSTPKGAASTFGFWGAVTGMAEVEGFLGNDEEQARYAELAKGIQAGFHGRWFNNSEVGYCKGSQGCNSFALGMGAVPEAIRPNILDAIVRDAERRGWALSAGEISLPSMFDALRDAGRNDVIYEIMRNDEAWGYGRMVREGATSLWEHWDLPVTGGSRNHFMFGYGDAWILGLSGLRRAPGAVGWDEVLFEPVVVGDLGFAGTRVLTPRGVAAARWERDGEVITYVIEVPVGSTGVVKMPAVEVKEGGEDVDGRKGALEVVEDEKGTRVVVGSGKYSLTGKLVL
ncbi:putative alpha-l-rhamnosidase protein [Colletotrichum karsti]|uniref:alpha-L-rhamnosidase n=1 Tax=Colletotrichum karsti TaxID=1095194 RepID=A0A9P6LI71_9PEZI|nr:putative alpha-l-rhamnosidase protein [Colletotrichum karsti]KAF9873345.1 putative alpha-l-rhamnosidase protein [Colletotrichum karsti]